MPTPEQPIIDSVPGFSAPAAVEAPVAHQGQPVPVEGFAGDPRRVIGHPSNSTNEAAQAYGDQLRAPAGPESTEWSEPTLYKLGGTAVQATPPAEK